MDEVARYNQARWTALAAANALFTRPHRDLTPETAQEGLDPARQFGDLRGKDVLCLAGGGGQQSAAFALLGANVTVFDLSAEQLERDRETAGYYGVMVTTIQGDMRDLSALPKTAFDLVFQPYSLNFVPDAAVVFQQVAGVLRNGGQYHFMCANPFFAGLRADDWNGTGYNLTRPYTPGAEIVYTDEEWVYDRESVSETVPPPREYRHTLSQLVNGLAENGFVLTHLTDSLIYEPDAIPGSWEHLNTLAPPWLVFLAAHRPAQKEI